MAHVGRMWGESCDLGALTLLQVQKERPRCLASREREADYGQGCLSAYCLLQIWIDLKTKGEMGRSFAGAKKARDTGGQSKT